MKYLSVLLLSLPLFAACDNDEPNPTPQPPTPAASVRTVSEADASQYGNWVYVNLETGETETHRDFTEWFYIDPQSKQRVMIPAQGSLSDVKIQWHIALRRELVKTNEGVAARTGSQDFEQAQLPAGATFVADAVETQRPLMMDMALMMTGKVNYSTHDLRNPLLSTWVQKTGTMPNIVYKPSNEVFVLRTKDNKLFKLQLTDFLDAKGKKGFVTLKAKAL